MPAARRDHSLTFDRDRRVIYLFGGRTAGQPRNDFWSFNPATGAWAEIPARNEPPPARFGHNAFYDDVRHRFIVALGQGGPSFFNDVWSFDPETETWRQLGVDVAIAPEARYGAGGGYDQAVSRILLTHGVSAEGRFDDTWTFGLASEQWTRVETAGEVPVKRCLTRALWVPGRSELLMFGGQTDSEPFLGDWWALSIPDLAWTEKKVSPLPGPRNLYGASISSDGNRWFIFGGNTPSGPVLDVWAYDIRQDAWQPVATGGPLPSQRYGLDVATFPDGRFYMFGGYDDTSELNDLWTLDIT